MASLAAIIVAALVVLWAWEGSPYGQYLNHDAATGAPLVGAALFTIGWLLMVIAMMLPSSAPLVVLFGGLVRRRRRPGRLVALLLVGYLLVWTTFGLAAWVADRAVHAAADSLPWLGAHPELIIGATLLAAGLWQFSPLRERCLDECRSPLGFVLNRWRGTSERREALLLGFAHGAFCVGCCWSLMLVMFGVGLGSLSMMLAIGGLTAIEKNLPSGRRLTRPIGVALILAAVYAVAS
jgi:predicted metal-binding membrane protein